MVYQVEAISSGTFLCGEGPVWDEKDEALYWCDCLGRSIFTYKEDGPHSGDRLFHGDMDVASLSMRQNGGLVVVGKNGFSCVSPEGFVTHLHHKMVDGIDVCNLNDIIAGPRGEVFSGQDAFVDGKPYEPGYLFRLDKNGELAIVAEGLHLSNGMGFSPDCASFYLADSIHRKIYKFDYDMAAGNIRNQKEVIHFGRAYGLPDGLTVDSDGFIWVAMFFGGKIVRLDPDGTIEREIRLPFTQPTSVMFGGRDLNELFVTSASFHWETEYAPEDHNYNSQKGGAVYRIKTDFQGKNEFKAAIS